LRGRERYMLQETLNLVTATAASIEPAVRGLPPERLGSQRKQCTGFWGGVKEYRTSGSVAERTP
ncbi:hypothetical protein TNCT_30701, partial [Trichonephila clavata]